MNLETVMARLDPWAFSPGASPVGIHAFATDWIEAEKGVDHRVKPGDDGYEWRSRT
jgi:hypothetical protein